MPYAVASLIKRARLCLDNRESVDNATAFFLKSRINNNPLQTDGATAPLAKKRPGQSALKSISILVHLSISASDSAKTYRSAIHAGSTLRHKI